jgi:DNA mismatch repair protein MutL
MCLMPRIQQLPPLVVNKIAAGEVIERPASVVKELLENAIDAGSRRIDVEIEHGGAELIAVSDDGCGIHPDDLELAFAAHATSKLHDADDLFRVGTLGFRGEALASVGGVARVTLQSRPPDLDTGAAITCHGGELGERRPWNGSAGTRVEVRHLFYNTPVRRRFLRTPPTEVGHVSEAFTRLALAHSSPVRNPGLHLTLTNNGKTVYDLAATATLLDRIGVFFGDEVSSRLYLVSTKQGPVALNGYIADPSCDRGHARMQYLFLNGRWIRDRSLGHAIQEAYRGLLMTGRYAVAFLFLSLAPEQVDVNVHPTKAEVRFRDAQAMYHLFFSAVKERLRRENLVPRLQAPASTMTTRPANGTPSSTPALPWTLTAPPPPAPPLPFATRPSAQAVLPPEAMPRRAETAEYEDFQPDAGQAPNLSQAEKPDLPVQAARPASNVIQLHDTFLVLETDQGMLVIDQHALHERVLFDQLKRHIQAGPLETQRLLIPEPVDLSAEQAARVFEQRDALAELGLHIEDFGGSTILLTTCPALFGRRSPQEVLRAVVDHLMTQERPPTREVLLNDLLSLMACHSAVRAGDRLTQEQMAALIEQRHLADDPHHCPHGRPTALLFSRHDLERQFGRV